MDDYIKREDALAAQNKSMNLKEMRERLKCLPAADVVEVRHGRWMRTDAFPHHVYCSVCSATYVPNDRWQIWEDGPGEGGLPRNYCPNCGAKMTEDYHEQKE